MGTDFNSSDEVIFDLNDKYIHDRAMTAAEEPELRRKRKPGEEEPVPEVDIPTEKPSETYAGTEIYADKGGKPSYRLFAAVTIVVGLGVLFFGGLLFTTTFMTKSIMQTSTQIAGGYMHAASAVEAPASLGQSADKEPEAPVTGKYFVKAFNPDVKGAAKMLKIDEAALKEFDEFVSSVMAVKPRPVLRSVFENASAASLPVIADTHNIYRYIMDVSQSAGRDISPEAALTEASAIAYYSREYGLSTELVVGVTQKESAFNPLAVSSKGAAGPMQVMYNIHYKLLENIGITRREELLTPDYGVKAGCYLLSRYINDKKSVTGALRSYYGELNPGYVSGIMSYRHAYELFSQGIKEDPIVMSSTENVDWKRMTNKTQPAKASAEKSASTAVRAGKNQKTNSGSGTLTTVYNNTEGRIKIQRPDGSVLIQKVIE